MSLCTDTNTNVVCFETATGDCVQLFSTRVHGLDANGDPQAPAILFSDAEGNIVDTSTGTVFAGGCPVGQQESTLFCELLADGTEVLFNRVVTIKTSPSGVVGTPVVNDYTTDYSAPYSVVDESKIYEPAPKCEPLVNTGLQTSWADMG